MDELKVFNTKAAGIETTIEDDKCPTSVL